MTHQHGKMARRCGDPGARRRLRFLLRPVRGFGSVEKRPGLSVASLGLQPQRLAEGRHGLEVLAKLHARVAEAGVRLEIARIQSDGLEGILLGCVEVVEGKPCLAAVGEQNLGGIYLDRSTVPA